MLGDLATLGGLALDDLMSLWGGAPRDTRMPNVLTRRTVSPRINNISRSTPTNLDRALWLLVQRSDLWSTLSSESHDLLAGAAPPYDTFFACLERSLHEHGPSTAAVVLQELRAVAERNGGAAVLSRIELLLPPDSETDLARELATTIDRLRLESVERELRLFAEAGQLTPDARQRQDQLRATQTRLKAELHPGPDGRTTAT
jgi:DNA primase